MGRSYRFRLSNMMPNAWFYKLKDMGSKQATKGSALLTHPSTARKSTRTPITPPRQFPSPTPPPPTPSSSLDKHHPAPLRPGRASYYIPSGDQDRLLCSPAHQPTKFVVVDPPRKSKNKSRRTPRPQLPPPVAVTEPGHGTGCGCRTTLGSVWTAEAEALSPEYPETVMDTPMRIYEAVGMGYYDYGIPCPDKRAVVVSDYKNRRDAGFPVDVESNSNSNSQSPSTTTTTVTTTTTTTTTTTNTFDAEAGDIDLRPILTKPAAKKERSSMSDLESPVKVILKNQNKGSGHRSKRSPPSASTVGVGLRMRVNSPRLAAASRKTAGLERARRSSAGSTAGPTTPRKSSAGGRLSGSLAVVKSSSNPRKDFRESMLEMIEENKLWASKDLEELLACYLSLNSTEYHDVIIKVFQQIWFDLTNLNNN